MGLRGMNMRMNAYLLLLAAAIAVLFSGTMWYTFVRQTPLVSATGIIASKIFIAARTIQRTQAGPRRESGSQDIFTIPDSYLLEIRVDGPSTIMQYSLAAQGAEKYRVGQKVVVKYAERGFPLMSKRFHVAEMRILNAEGALEGTTPTR
jgi:hypothetical protein